MVSLPRALGSTPVAATPRPASTVATDAAQEVTSTAAAEQLGRTVPRLYVEFLLVDGSRKAYQIGSEMTVGAVKKAVWNAWPEGKLAERDGGQSNKLKLKSTGFVN